MSNAPDRQLRDLQRHLHWGGHQLDRERGRLSRGSMRRPRCSTASSRSSTSAGTSTTSRRDHFTNGVAKFQNNIFWNFASNGVAQPYWQNAAAAWVLTNAANNNLFVNPMLTSISRTNDPAFAWTRVRCRAARRWTAPSPLPTTASIPPSPIGRVQGRQLGFGLGICGRIGASYRRRRWHTLNARDRGCCTRSCDAECCAERGEPSNQLPHTGWCSLSTSNPN